MSIEENAKQFCSIVMPLCLVLAPVALLIELHAFFIADPRVSKASNISTVDLIFLNILIFNKINETQ